MRSVPYLKNVNLYVYKPCAYFLGNINTLFPWLQFGNQLGHVLTCSKQKHKYFSGPTWWHSKTLQKYAERGIYRPAQLITWIEGALIHLVYCPILPYCLYVYCTACYSWLTVGSVLDLKWTGVYNVHFKNPFSLSLSWQIQRIVHFRKNVWRIGILVWSQGPNVMLLRFDKSQMI